MAKSFIELVIGSLDEKRAYRRYMKRVKALPRDYRFAFKKIQNYTYNCDLSGCDMTMYVDLAELFEQSAAQGKPVLEVIGSDVSRFCDELIRESSSAAQSSREKFNKGILEHFGREGK